MSEWRFLAYDLRTSAFLMELPVTGWSSSDPLSGVGSWSAQVKLDGAAATSTTARRTSVADSTRKGRTLVVAERDGVPVFDGIIWARRYSASDRILQLAGANLSSYFDHWDITTELGPFYDVEQFTIFRAMVAAVQAAPAGDIGIIVDSGNSGVVRTRTEYTAYSSKKFGALMRELSDVQSGFDFSFRVEYEAGVPVRRCRLFYPRRGRDLTATNLRFYAPGNAVLFDVDENASDMATTVVALGAGDGADMLISSASQTDLIAAGWPGYRQTRAYKDVSKLVTLGEHANADVARLSGVDDENYTVQVDPNSTSQPFGAWTIGDDCNLIVADDPLYPAQTDGSPGLVATRRVMQHDWRVSGSSEELFVTLGRKVVP